MKKKGSLKQVFMEFLMLLGSILLTVDAAHSASTSMSGSTKTSIQFDRIGTIPAPLAAMADDEQGNVYALTADGAVIRIAPDGTFTSIYSGVERCELSRSALTVLPQGDVIVNDCLDHVDTIVKIDREGTATSLLQSEHPIISLASDASDNVYIGFWTGEGDVTIEGEPSLLTQAEGIQGQVAVLEPDGTLKSLYEGGLPFALTASEQSVLYSSVWGESGAFTLGTQDFRLCDSTNLLWIGLSDQVVLQQIRPEQSSESLTNDLYGITEIAIDQYERFFVLGHSQEGECGIYTLTKNEAPQQLMFAEESFTYPINHFAISGDTLYVTDTHGNIYIADLFPFAPREIQAETFYQQAGEHHRTKNYENAIALYTKTIEANPKYTEAYLNRGLIYLLNNNQAAANEDYTKFIELQPDFDDEYSALKFLLFSQGAPDELRPLFQKAYQADSQNIVLTVALGHTYLFDGDSKKAREYYRKALALLKEEEDFETVAASFNMFIEKDRHAHVLQQELTWLKNDHFHKKAKEYWDQAQRHESQEQYFEAALLYEKGVEAEYVSGKPRETWLVFALKKAGELYDGLEQYDKALALYQQAVEVAINANQTGDAAELSNKIGRIYYTLAQYADARAPLEQAVTLTRESGKTSTLASYLNLLGLVYHELGHYQQALAAYEEALGIARQLNNQFHIATFLNNIGMAYKAQGQYLQARDYLEQALTLARQLNETDSILIYLDNLGAVYDALRQSDKALVLYAEELELSRQSDEKARIARVLNVMGLVYDDLEQYDQALSSYNQALELNRALKSDSAAAANLNNIGLVYQDLQQYPKALEYLVQALELARQLGKDASTLTYLNNIGGLYREQRQADKALEYFEPALELARKLNDAAGMATALNSLGLVYHSQGDYPKALTSYEEAIKLTRASGKEADLAIYLYNLGTLYQNQENAAKALAPYGEALRLFRKLGDHDNMVEVSNRIGQMYVASGMTAKAIAHYEQAAAEWEQAKDYDNVIAFLRNVIQLDSQRAETHARIGKYLFMQEKFVEARQTYQDACTLEPGNVAWTMKLGHTHLLTGDVMTARTYYKKALSLIESEEEFQAAVADFKEYIEQGWQAETFRQELAWMQQEFAKPSQTPVQTAAAESESPTPTAESVELADKALQTQEKSSSLEGVPQYHPGGNADKIKDLRALLQHVGIALYYNARDYLDAIEWCTAELERDPANVKAYWYRALSYGLHQKQAEASANFEKVIALAPHADGAYGNLGWYLMIQGRLEEVQKVCRKAYELAPKRFGWAMNLGHTYLLIDDAATARQYYTYALAWLQSEAEFRTFAEIPLGLFINKEWQKETARQERDWLKGEFKRGNWGTGQASLPQAPGPSPSDEQNQALPMEGAVKAMNPELSIQTRHSGEITSIAFSPDGKMIASGSEDSTVKLWDAQTGKELYTLSGHADKIFFVAFSLDGQTLASGSNDSFKLWDVYNGTEIYVTGEDESDEEILRKLAGYSFSVSNEYDCVALSSNNIFAVHDYGAMIKLFDVSTNQELHTLEGHAEDVVSIAFSADGRTLASAGEDHTIKLWDVQTGDEIMTFTGDPGDVIALAFSPDGLTLVSGNSDNTITLWDVRTGRRLYTVTGHSYGAITVVFSPDGQMIASGGVDKTIKLWDIAHGEAGSAGR